MGWPSLRRKPGARMLRIKFRPQVRLRDKSRILSVYGTERRAAVGRSSSSQGAFASSVDAVVARAPLPARIARVDVRPSDCIYSDSTGTNCASVASFELGSITQIMRWVLPRL
jgi:hypothetical protein